MLRKGDEPVPGYRLVRFLGRGQYGEVWEAKGPGGTRVALKFIDVSGAQGQKELRGVQRVKEIRHPHLMPITALWLLDEEGSPLDDSYFQTVDGGDQREAVNATLTVEAMQPSMLVVAMGYCDENLSDRLKEVNQGLPEAEWHGIPVEELLVYVVESAKAIDFLNSPRHDLGDGPVSIQHCDIKPANIMLVGGSVQVCDFGLARMMGDKLKATATGMIGSPAFMAPECIQKRPSSASDQYSLAITYYELRTGHLPFRDLAYMAVFEAHQKGTLDFSAVGDAEQAVLRQATAIEPEDRYDSCMEMVKALQQALVGEFPDLRASDDGGKLRAQQSVASASATDTVRATGTAREGESRPRRAMPWGVAVGLMFALLVLAGIVAAVAIPAFPNLVVGPLDSDNGKVDPEPKPPPINFAAALKEAEKTLQEREYEKAAEAFAELERGLRKSSAADSAGLLDYALLGALRVQARQPDVDWSETLTKLQQLSQSSSLDEQALARIAALQLLGKTTLSQPTLEERIKEHVGLLPLKKHLDPWENAEIERIQTDTLGAAAEAMQNGQLAFELIDDVEKLGGDKIGLLLALAERQYKRSEYELSRQTLGEARPDAAGDQQNRWEELLLMNGLADDAFPASKAVRTFALVAKKLQDPSTVATLLLERARRNPEVIDMAEEQLKQVHDDVPSEISAQLDKPYASLLTLRIRTRLASSDVSVDDQIDDCEKVRKIDQTNPLVNVCWVECKLVLQPPDEPIAGPEWSTFDGIVQESLGGDELDVAHQAYVHFVAGLLMYHNPVDGSKEAAQEIVKAREMSTLLLDGPRRRQQALDILLAAVEKLRLPTDDDLAYEPALRENHQLAFQFLQAGESLEEPARPTWQAKYMVAAALVGQLDAAAQDKLLTLSDELLAKDEVKSGLKDQNLLGQVLLVSAKSFAARYEQKKNPEDFSKAVKHYAELIALLHDPRSARTKIAESAFYERVVEPAYRLASMRSSNLDGIPDTIRAPLALILATRGRLLQRDLNVQQTSSLGGNLVALAEKDFQDAIEFDEKRAEYLVGLGQTIIRSPDHIERLDELRKLAEKAEALDPTLPAVFRIKGFVAIKDSRRTPDREKSHQLLSEAIDACEKAIELGDKDDDDRATCYEALSAAYLEAAFNVPHNDLNQKQDSLLKAEKAARAAIAIIDRPLPENAFNALGNALEDQAHYLREVDKFDAAIEAFRNGKLAATAKGRAGEESSYAAGRVYLRQVQNDTSLLPGDRTSKLKDGEDDLNYAIGVWERAPKTLRPLAVQERIAESKFWISAIEEMRANLVTDRKAKLESLSKADQIRKESVELAEEAKAVFWPSLQTEWADLAVTRATVQQTWKEQEELLNEASERLDRVFVEEAEKKTFQVSSNVLDRARVVKSRQLFQHARMLYFASINGSNPPWKKAAPDVKKYAEEALATARKIERKQDWASAESNAIRLLGNFVLRDAFNSKAPNASESDLEYYRDAIKSQNNELPATAIIRLVLADALQLRLKLLSTAQQKEAKAEGIRVLTPIQELHLPPDEYKEVQKRLEQLRRA